MPFSELDDAHPYRYLTTPSGVEIELWTNDCPAEAAYISNLLPESRNTYRNDQTLRTALMAAGIMYAPEVPAYASDGSELPMEQAYYVDRRIGMEATWGIAFWINGVARLPEGGGALDREFSPSEMRFLVGMAMDELGLSDRLAKIRYHDTQTTPEAPDLNEILKQARELETFHHTVDSPQHLAPDDLI